ncbi:MAG: Gfo/Idh/MocA family oxidoreductase [bacterium]|nr:Gfo/Idh/MocA family oxidoreductase [bacterium]
MAEEQIRIGIIGAGGIFRNRHFPGLAKVEAAQVVAICNRSEQSGQKVVSENGFDADVMTDPYALVGRDDIDAVMIGTWPYKHCEYVMASLDAGKHTFVQARMAMNLRDAKAMYAKSQETDRVTQICPAPPWKGGRFLKRLVQEGYLGDLYNLYVWSPSDGRADPDQPLHWRDVDRYSGLNILGMGITVERVHRVFGYMETVSAQTEIFTKERPLSDGSGTGPVERPDMIHAMGKMENGAQAVFLFSGVARFGEGSRIEAYGSEGTLIYDLDNDTVRGGKAGDDGLKELPIPEDEVAEWTVEEDFIGAIQGGPQGDTSFYEGVKYMEFTEAVSRSVEQGRTVHLPLVD